MTEAKKPKRKSAPKAKPDGELLTEATVRKIRTVQTDYTVKDLCKAGQTYKSLHKTGADMTDRYAEISEMHSEFQRQSNPSQQDKDFAKRHMQGIPKP